MEKLTVEQLTEILKQAEEAHGAYEKVLGQRDDNWAEWYAKFMLPKLEEC